MPRHETMRRTGDNSTVDVRVCFRSLLGLCGLDRRMPETGLSAVAWPIVPWVSGPNNRYKSFVLTCVRRLAQHENKSH